MATTDPTRENITTANYPTIGAEMRRFVRSLTTYSRHPSAMERAYGDHGPDSYKRALEQRRAWEQMQRPQASPTKVRAVNAKAKSKARRSRRRATRRLRQFVVAICAHELCSKPFERRAHNHRFCSRRCQRHAARLREMAARRVALPGDVTKVLAEMEAALARLRALMVEEDGR